MLGMLAWTGRQRQKQILLLYKIAHKGRTEWKGTVFDIRRRYLREFHEKLDALYAGIELYARYRKRSGEDEETQRISLSQHQKKGIDWENNSSVKIRSICYEWSDDEKQMRLEYRRTPAQVYAARFLQTKGIGAEDHEQLKHITSRRRMEDSTTFCMGMPIGNWKHCGNCICADGCNFLGRSKCLFG